MVLVRRSAWDPFNGLVRQLDRDFEGLTRRVFGQHFGESAFVPAADIERDGSDAVIRLELPGVDIDKDVDVEVSDGRLIVRGKRSTERTQTSDDGKPVLVREIRSGEFRREFDLPEGVTAEQVEADYDRGVLSIRVRDVVRPVSGPKKVEIRDSAQQS